MTRPKKRFGALGAFEFMFESCAIPHIPATRLWGAPNRSRTPIRGVMGTYHKTTTRVQLDTPMARAHPPVESGRAGRWWSGPGGGGAGVPGARHHVGQGVPHLPLE